MSIRTSIDLAAAFEGREVKPAPEQVPERIRKDAPKPELKPGGGWAERAARVDQAVREAQDAQKAKNEWAQRINIRHRHGIRQSFRMSAS